MPKKDARIWAECRLHAAKVVGVACTRADLRPMYSTHVGGKDNEDAELKC